MDIVLQILQCAAEAFVYSDRQSAVALAQTSSLSYNTIKPILYQRLAITKNNVATIDHFISNVSLHAYVRALAIGEWSWRPPAELVANVTGLQSLSGITDPVYQVLRLLHPSNSANIKRIQLWDAGAPLDDIPLSVTHVCLYIEDARTEIAESGLIRWIKVFPSLTHLGIEVVAHIDHNCGLAAPDSDDEDESLAQSFDEGRRERAQTMIDEIHLVLDSGGSSIEQVAVRVGGWMADGVPWHALVTAAVHNPDTRIRLWRDQRKMRDYGDDTASSIGDALAGIDIWSESLPVMRIGEL